MEFTYCKLIDVLSDIHSGGTPSTEESSYWGGNIKWLSSGETSQRFISDTVDKITEEGVKNSSTKLAKKNNIVMACAGQGKTRGQTSYLLDDMYINQSVIALETKTSVLPLYLFYDLSSRYEELRGGSDASSTRGSITTTALKNLPFKYPDLSTQQSIVDILFGYDSLIEANNRRIELLEQAAQELYREWFVRFRFPGYEDVKFENSLPEGWERNKIQKYYNTCSGGTPSRSKPEYFENGVYPWVKTGEIKDCVIIDTEEYITQEAVNNSSAKVLPAKSVAMAMYGVNIGLLAYFDSEMTCNQACCVFSDKRDFSSKHYLYYYLKSIREYLLLISFGAAQQNLSQDLIKKLKITMPSDDVVQAFEKQVDDIYGNIRMLLLRNKNLAEQRDMLLPRLMSGKLEV
jgi:type I restriction enzyme S subunit